MEFKDLGKPVAFLAKMIGHRPLAVQLVGNGLLDPNRMRTLLDRSCPREVTLDVLMIISDLARMDKVGFVSFKWSLLHMQISRIDLSFLLCILTLFLICGCHNDVP